MKVLVDPERAAGEQPEPAAAGSGTAYLMQRREERRRKEEAGDRAAALADDVHRRLQERAVAARLRPAQNRELSGYEGEMVLNGAYLVERGPAGGIDALVGELAERLTRVRRADRAGRPVPAVLVRPGGIVSTGAVAQRDVALVDLVDRLLGGGVVIAGEITLAVADVDLVHVSLRALVSSVGTAQRQSELPRTSEAP